MSTELHDLLATAAADYRARGDLATAARFDAVCASRVLTSEVLAQPSEIERYEEFERALVLSQNRAAVEPKRVAYELWKLVCSQHERMLGALRKENEALRICYGDQQDKRLAAEHELSELKIEHGTIQARVAELEADLLRSAEGTDILGGLISSIEKHGNYSAESTVVFLRQALGCFNRFTPVPDAAVKCEVSRDE